VAERTRELTEANEALDTVCHTISERRCERCKTLPSTDGRSRRSTRSGWLGLRSPGGPGGATPRPSDSRSIEV
jgi:hypothetical protein